MMRRLTITALILSSLCGVGRSEDYYPAFEDSIRSGIERLLKTASRTNVRGAPMLPKSRSVTVAVFPFRHEDGGVLRFGNFARGFVESALSEDNRVRLVDRERVDTILREKDFSNADFVDPDSLVASGRFDAAEILLFGETSSPLGRHTTLKLTALSAGRGKGTSVVQTVLLPVPLSSLERSALFDSYVNDPPDGKKIIAKPPLSFQFFLFAKPYDNADGPGFLMRNGDALRSGDLFQITLTPCSDCYVYIFCLTEPDAVEKEAEIVSWFPHPHIGATNPMKGVSTYRIPDIHPVTGERRYYQLDNTPGLETIFIVASYSPESGLESFLKTLEGGAVQYSSVQLQDRICELVRTPPASQRKYRIASSDMQKAGKSVRSHLTEAMSSEYAVIRTLTFRHFPRTFSGTR
jgi:hypothetical protein